ncbi:MAG: alpha/beta hydrolase family protein [Phycisphaerales bacterium JB047]
MSTNRLILLLTLFTTPVFALAQPQQTPAGTDVGEEQIQVRTRSFVLHDEMRGKDLPVRVVYPDAFTTDDPVPTIIFSHGAGGSGNFYNPLAHHWASNGYIVILPTHSDSQIGGESVNDETTPRKRLRQMLERRRSGTRGLDDIDFTDWPNRPRDISFLIDQIDAIETQVPAIADRIDPDRIGVGGHSYGAFTAQLIGGTDPIGPGEFSDQRAQCVLLISPQGVGGVLQENAWDDFVGPALTISGDNDAGRGGEPAAWRREGFDRSPPDTHTLLWIDDAYHNFGGISGRILPGPDQGPENPHHVQLVQQATLAFWTTTSAMAQTMWTHSAPHCRTRLGASL